MWVAETEGAKFWLHVVTELKNRGVQDIFIACVDGLKGFPEAIETVFPQAQVQLCIVHIVRNSLKYVSWKQRKKLTADLKKIYQSSTAEQAEMHLVLPREMGQSAFHPSASPGKKTGIGSLPFRLSARELHGDLYDECNRIVEHVAS